MVTLGKSYKKFFIPMRAEVAVGRFLGKRTEVDKFDDVNDLKRDVVFTVLGWMLGDESDREFRPLRQLCSLILPPVAFPA